MFALNPFIFNYTSLTSIQNCAGILINSKLKNVYFKKNKKKNLSYVLIYNANLTCFRNQ